MTLCKRLIFFIFLSQLLLACSHNKHNNSTLRSMYYWQTTFNTNDSVTQKFLREHRVSRLYVRFFDVVMRQDEPMPNATISFKHPVDGHFDIVPVVFITNDVMQHPRQGLASRVLKRIVQMCQTHDIGPIKEVQIDCDWTLSTRRTYYNFLQELHDLTARHGIRLSTTIRFHQLSHPAPPVDCGVLMIYNTGEISDYNEHHPILDMRSVDKYLPYLSQYPLRLSAAYPIFSWKVLFRAHQFIGIVHSKDEYPIVAGDEIVTRSVQTEQLFEAHQTIERLRPDANNEVILYDLQPQNIIKYKYKDYEKVFNH